MSVAGYDPFVLEFRRRQAIFPTDRLAATTRIIVQVCKASLLSDAGALQQVPRLTLAAAAT